MQRRRAALLLVAASLVPVLSPAAEPPVGASEQVVLKTLSDAERTRLRTLIEVRKARLSATLTPEQRALLEAHEESVRAQRLQRAAERAAKLKVAVLKLKATRKPVQVAKPASPARSGLKPDHKPAATLAAQANPPVMSPVPVAAVTTPAPAEPLSMPAPDRSN